MARVNLNIAITAMITEKPLQGNQSSTVCEREYEFGTFPTKLNSTLSGETDENGDRSFEASEKPGKVDITTVTQQ